MAPTVSGLSQFLRSRAFFRFLHDTSELDLVEHCGEVRAIGPGDYTLCRDTDPMLARAALDVVLTVGPSPPPSTKPVAAADSSAPALDDEGFEIVSDDDGTFGSYIYLVREARSR